MYVGRSKSCTHYQKFANMSLRKQVFIFGFPKKEVLGVDPLPPPWNITTLSYRHWFWIPNFSSYIVPLQHFIKLFISLQSNIISHEFWKKLWTYSEIFDGFWWNSVHWKWMFSRSQSNTFTLFRIKFIDPLQYINRLSVRGDF